MSGYLKDQDFIELPLFEYSMDELFNLISLDDFIRLLTCVLLEYRIILFSNCKNKIFFIVIKSII